MTERTEARLDGNWSAGIEVLDCCPVCRSRRRTLALDGAEDIVFHVAPGKWQMYGCDECGLHYLDPRPSADSVHLAYETYYTHSIGEEDDITRPRGVSHRLRNGFLAWRLHYELPSAEPLGRLYAMVPHSRKRRWERLVRDLPAPKPGARLLDVGCGSGEFLSRMRSLGWIVFGQEVDAKAAEAARSLGVDVVLGPLSRQAFTHSFDAITMHHVIEHLHDPISVLEECRALLKPGGILWIATPNIASASAKRFRTFWRGLEAPRHLFLFTVESLDRALAEAGFDNRDVKADVGMYGSVGTSLALRRRETGKPPPSAVRVRAENFLADALMTAIPRLGEELVATARS